MCFFFGGILLSALPWLHRSLIFFFAFRPTGDNCRYCSNCYLGDMFLKLIPLLPLRQKRTATTVNTHPVLRKQKFRSVTCKSTPSRPRACRIWPIRVCVSQVDAAAVHLANGVWGMVAGGLFASEEGYSAAYYADRSQQ